MRLMPFEFRSDFGDEMQEVFRQERREAALEGRSARRCGCAPWPAWCGRRRGSTWTHAGRTSATRRVACGGLPDCRSSQSCRWRWASAPTRDLRLPEHPVPERAPCSVGARSDRGRLRPRRRARASGRLTHADFEALRDATRTLADVAAPRPRGSGCRRAARAGRAVRRSRIPELLLGARRTSGARTALKHPTEWSAGRGARPARLAGAIRRRARRARTPRLAQPAALHRRRRGAEGFTGIYAGGTRGLWIPTGSYDGWTAGEGYNLVGRLAAGRTVAEAQAELTVLASVRAHRPRPRGARRAARRQSSPRR